MFRFDLFFVCFTFAVCIARDPKLTIEIPNQGKIKGVEVSKLRVQKITAYYGIPYAQPPVGDLRFAPPSTDPLPQWDDIKQDSDYPASCMQSASDIRDSEKPFIQVLPQKNLTLSEDCLYLNIFTPYGEGPKPGYATIVWFHPGNFTTGSPSMWNPHTLVYRHRIIVVTVGWRLNILGFLVTVDETVTGNYGLMDQQAAMKWVKNNIKLFGGDPDNISIMGYGSGAVSVALHMINPVSRGLFNKAISMSGNIFSPDIVQDPKDSKKTLYYFDKFGCKIPSGLLTCLRHVGAELLVQGTTDTNWGPIRDAGLLNATNPFLHEHPLDYFKNGDFAQVPLLTGYTQMERVTEIDSIKNVSSTSTENLQNILQNLISIDMPPINKSDTTCSYNYDHLTDAVMFFYGPTRPIKDDDQFREIVVDFATEREYASSTYRLANFMSKYQPTYMYRFDIRPSTTAAVSTLPEWITVPHLFDLIYVWGIPYWTPEIEWDYRDKRFSDTIMSFWTNFAKTANPTESGIYPVVWNRFSEDDPGILFIDGTFNMSNSKNLNYKAFEFWNDYYPKVREVATQCCENFDAGASSFKQNIVQILTMVVFVYFFNSA